MGQTEVRAIKELLPKLTVAELKDIETSIEFYKNTRGLGGMISTEADLFYQALMEELKFRINISGFPRSISSIAKRNPVLYKRILKTLDDVEAWMTNSFGKVKPNRLQRRRLYSILASLVAGEIENTSVPLSLSTLVNFFSNVPGIINKAFPGYASSGMLWILLEQDGEIAPEENVDKD